MAPIGNTVRERFARFQSLASNLRPRLPEMPALADNHAAFEELVVRIQASLAEQDVLASRTSELIRTREEDMKQALELRHRLAGQLQGHFGTGSEKLREFGIKPRRRRSRRKSETPAPEEPVAAPEAPTDS
jgi:hypothetical protein